MNPIRRVLSTMRQRDVRCHLTGGRACVWYGAAESVRDTDLTVLASPGNVAALAEALGELDAATIAGRPSGQTSLPAVTPFTSDAAGVTRTARRPRGGVPLGCLHGPGEEAVGGQGCMPTA